MNISKYEQRVLHALAQGGRIAHEQTRGKVTEILCFTRDGMILSDCDMTLFQRLRRRRLIESRSGAPYRISRRGREAVRAQPDNR